MQAMNAV